MFDKTSLAQTWQGRRNRDKTGRENGRKQNYPDQKNLRPSAGVALLE
jgi:hypothetical protein